MVIKGEGGVDEDRKKRVLLIFIKEKIYYHLCNRNANGLSIIRRQGIETLEALLD